MALEGVWSCPVFVLSGIATARSLLLAVYFNPKNEGEAQRPRQTNHHVSRIWCYSVIRFSMNPLGLHPNPTRELCRPWQC